MFRSEPRLYSQVISSASSLLLPLWSFLPFCPSRFPLPLLFFRDRKMSSTPKPVFTPRMAAAHALATALNAGSGSTLPAIIQTQFGQVHAQQCHQQHRGSYEFCGSIVSDIVKATKISTNPRDVGAWLSIGRDFAVPIVVAGIINLKFIRPIWPDVMSFIGLTDATYPWSHWIPTVVMLFVLASIQTAVLLVVKNHLLRSFRLTRKRVFAANGAVGTPAFPFSPFDPNVREPGQFSDDCASCRRPSTHRTRIGIEQRSGGIVMSGLIQQCMLCGTLRTAVYQFHHPQSTSSGATVTAAATTDVKVPSTESLALNDRSPAAPAILSIPVHVAHTRQCHAQFVCRQTKQFEGSPTVVTSDLDRLPEHCHWTADSSLFYQRQNCSSCRLAVVACRYIKVSRANLPANRTVLCGRQRPTLSQHMEIWRCLGCASWTVCSVQEPTENRSSSQPNAAAPTP